MAAPQFPDSLPAFMRLFPDEAHCAAYLERVRWPDGFVCPSCGSEGDPNRISTRPEVLRCRYCRRETSLTAGTVMHRSHSPLSLWFWGAYLVSSQTPGMSALQFQRQLGMTRYETAFQMLHKLRAGMVRPERDRIGSYWPVELDETYVGGKTKGKGRGVHHMTIVVGAVEVCESDKKDPAPSRVRERHYRGIPTKGSFYAGRLRLHVVPDRGQAELEAFTLANIEPGADVVTDGWTGYDRLASMGYKHTAVVMDPPELADKHLPMIHIVFSNLKAWLLGVHHGVSPQHLQAYCNEFTFRFNRRFYPFVAFNSLLGIGTHVSAPTYDELYSHEWVHPNPELG